MADCYGATTFRCDMCRKDFSSPLLMAFHVLKVEKHRRRLSHVAPQQVKELARLQYFLDTHMKEEPILGLEYIAEEQLEPEKYRYTCQLCHQWGDPYAAFVHIMSKEHMERYIEKHHPSLLVINSNLPIAALSLRELRARALAIQKEYGRKEMQRKQSAGNSPAKQQQASPKQQQQASPEQQQQASPEQQQQASPEQQQQASPILLKNHFNCICTTCNVFCGSFSSLFAHIVGNKHRTLLRKVAPGDLKKLARMQYILDNYLKECPFVGLEYVVERQDSGSYRYTCSLCNVEADLYQSLYHVIGKDHMVRYIGKHHSSMLPLRLPCFNDVVYARMVREIALTIHRTYGCKRIQTEGSFVRGSLMTEEARSLPTVVARPSATEEARPLPPEDVNEESGPFLHDGEGLDNCRPCRLCNAVFLSPVDLWKHVVESKHKEILSKTSPKDLKELGRLQYFLNNHMKKDPLLGLEYIVEEQLDSTSYKYTCQLCNVEGDLPQMITHISYVDHVERYIDKDHSDLSLRIYTYPERADYIKALTKIAFIILDKCGRQDIVLQCK